MYIDVIVLIASNNNDDANHSLFPVLSTHHVSKDFELTTKYNARILL
jgi:hypothetical protein